MEIGGPWRQQQSFMTHIRTSTNEKPHLLIAYTWILYMALFSGGRHIRARLLSAGPKFWGVEEEDPPLSFWTFPSSTDGEDLKTLYKAQVLELSTSLTELERKEIVAGGVEIMSTMLKLVDEVDELSNPYKLTPRGRELSLPEEQTPPLLKRLSNLFK
jgi:heme oxygenase